MHFQYVVIGAGFAGSVIARRIAEEIDTDVLIVEKHSHIAGHAHDAFNEHGVLIHTYGPHIFHTNEKAVWDWLSRFTSWYQYQHRVLSYVDGLYIPMPIGVETVNKLFNLRLSVDEIESWFEEHREKVEQCLTSEDVVLSRAGKLIYEKLFKNYTYKQWERYPSELDSSVISRIPIRMDRDTRYFSDRYQGLPKEGYTRMFERILDHPRIHLLLSTDWFHVKNEITYDRLFYTGPVDRYYDYRFGSLGYRSVRFEYESFYDREFYQDVGVVNYPNDYDFTRITEYKRLTGQRVSHTTIAREYSSAEGEPFYIIPDKRNQELAEQYRILTEKEKKVSFYGRLAEYRYYNMDQIVGRILKDDSIIRGN